MKNLESAAPESSKTNNKWKPKGNGPFPERPLERVEIDTTPLDIFVLDEKTGSLLGQPICTFFIDKATRLIHSVLISNQ